MFILDNFLTNEEHSIIKNIMMGNNFPWFISPIVAQIENDLDGKEFTHMFYSEIGFSDYSSIINPILNKIKYKEMYRIRAALMPRNTVQKENGWHIDTNTVVCTTAIYYVNSNNGYTKFKNGEKVESVENRFLFFDSRMEHTGVHATNTNFRCLINFNYI